MLESNPPRNSQPETHPDDERGGRWPRGLALSSDGKISLIHSENSYQKVAAQPTSF